MSVIRVDSLSKQYRIGQKVKYKAFRDTLAHAARAPFAKLRSMIGPSNGEAVSSHMEDDVIWALKDISFEVRHGEAVGIIGRNGAGKSTLLKILSRITVPTRGYGEIRGRVGSLLEVGTGFHPELTGRENIFLNGAILGMHRSEIVRRFDEIVAFAEVEKFVDTPVKHYSSGMYVRLAFAVAAHLEPEILLVDEVLAVGDAAFQQKCLGKMGDVTGEGRTILFVSHNMTALQSLCRRAILITNGKLAADGRSEEIVSTYLTEGLSCLTDQTWVDPESAPGNDQIRIHRIRVLPDASDGSALITVRTPISIVFEYWNFLEDAYLNLSLVVYDLQGVCVFNSTTESKAFPIGLIRGVCNIPGDFLNDNIYRIRILIVKESSVPLLDCDNIAMFQVHDVARDINWYGKWVGVVRPHFDWTHEILEAPCSS